MPELNDLPRLREESVAADVEQEAIVPDRAADSTDVVRVLLNNKNGRCFLRQTIGGRQARRSRADDENVDNASASGLFAGKWHAPVAVLTGPYVVHSVPTPQRPASVRD